jgi:hypothetical protein
MTELPPVNALCRLFYRRFTRFLHRPVTTPESFLTIAHFKHFDSPFGCGPLSMIAQAGAGTTRFQ